ncbi:hypothetical protein AB0G00_32575 [Nocardia salmonicida]|uniref:hypothetical protein n=1 Tax=Nocardia salmonicida TaxID=53431 RepID=UPI0033FD4D56
MLLIDTDQQGRLHDTSVSAPVLWVAVLPVTVHSGAPDVWHQAVAVASSGWFGVLTLLSGLVATGLAAATVAEIAARVIRLCWLGYRLPRCLALLLVRWRRWRWDSANLQSQTASTEFARRHAGQRRNRIALAVPESPTWMGDRVAALDSRVRSEYGIDVASAWSRLWLLLSESERTDLREARRRNVRASRAMAWAGIYAVTAVLWWPLSIVAIAGAIAALTAGRAATAAATDLAEALVDLHAVALAGALGVEVNGEVVTSSEGRNINRRNRKGA